MDTVYRDLTNREKEVLLLLIQGKNNKEIAKELIISTHTAKTHVGAILRKFEVKNKVQATIYAIKNNIIEV